MRGRPLGRRHMVAAGTGRIAEGVRERESGGRGGPSQREQEVNVVAMPHHRMQRWRQAEGMLAHSWKCGTARCCRIRVCFWNAH